MIYRDPRTGEVITGPGAVLRAGEQTRPPEYGDEDEARLIRRLELAIVDGDEEHRKKIESQIMRGRLSASLAEPETPSGVSRTRDTAREYYEKKDNERGEHWSSAFERVQQAARGPWATAPTDHEMQQNRMKGQR